MSTLGMRGPTLQQRLVDTEGRPAGFDYLRLVLAVLVIVSHAFLLPYGPGYKIEWGGALLGPVFFQIVPMFFALSGFLVAGSLHRCKTLVSFLLLRVLRIMPALSVEVLLSALILGPLLTTLPLAEYFRHPDFIQYFWNLVGHIHYDLPGLFKDNPLTSVNGQLWTVPYELVCYIVLSVAALFGVFQARHRMLWLLAAFYLLQVVNTVWRPNYEYYGAGGSTLVMCFVAGLVFHRYADRIVWHGGLALVCAVVSLALVTVPNGVRFIAVPATYLTCYLGLCNPPRQKLLLGGDYSYGLYLYGYPIQQMVVALLPQAREWTVNLALALPLSALVAWVSWWAVERPVVMRKGVVKAVEARYLAWRSHWFPAAGRMAG